MLRFGVTIPATVLQGSEIPEGLMNNPVFAEEHNTYLHDELIVTGFLEQFYLQNRRYLTAKKL